MLSMLGKNSADGILKVQKSSKVYSLKHKQLIMIIIQIHILVQVKNDMKVNRRMG